MHIKNAFQVIDIETDQGQIRLAVSRHRIALVVDHIRATEPSP